VLVLRPPTPPTPLVLPPLIPALVLRPPAPLFGDSDMLRPPVPLVAGVGVSRLLAPSSELHDHTHAISAVTSHRPPRRVRLPLNGDVLAQPLSRADFTPAEWSARGIFVQ
jgi:hypothetical protein